MRRLLVILGRLFGIISLKYGFYYKYSRLIRFLLEKQYAPRSIRKYSSLSQLSNFFYECKWKADPWWRDVISYPARAEKSQNDTGYLGDCDEFAAYAASAIGGMGLKDIDSISILTVTYIGKPWTDYYISGHNVCVFRYKDEDGHWWWANMSNWRRGKVVWRDDYGRRFGSPAEVATWITTRKSGTSIGWARVSNDLKTVYGYGVVPERM